MKNCFSNNQENSSIFRLANMYNMPETDDEYAKTYNSLSDDEKMFIAQYPTYAAKFYLNSKEAKKAVENLSGKRDGYADAVRHCYWCALNQMYVGYNSSLAERYGNAHENIPNNEAKMMDLYNNSVGYLLGKEGIVKGWSEKDLLKNVIKAANDGRLQIGL